MKGTKGYHSEPGPLSLAGQRRGEGKSTRRC